MSGDDLRDLLRGADESAADYAEMFNDGALAGTVGMADIRDLALVRAAYIIAESLVLIAEKP